jgi:hypothetical protein
MKYVNVSVNIRGDRENPGSVVVVTSQIYARDRIFALDEVKSRFGNADHSFHPTFQRLLDD